LDPDISLFKGSVKGIRKDEVTDSEKKRGKTVSPLSRRDCIISAENWEKRDCQHKIIPGRHSAIPKDERANNQRNGGDARGKAV